MGVRREDRRRPEVRDGGGAVRVLVEVDADRRLDPRGRVGGQEPHRVVVAEDHQHLVAFDPDAPGRRAALGVGVAARAAAPRWALAWQTRPIFLSATACSSARATVWKGAFETAVTRPSSARAGKAAKQTTAVSPSRANRRMWGSPPFSCEPRGPPPYSRGAGIAQVWPGFR